VLCVCVCVCVCPPSEAWGRLYRGGSMSAQYDGNLFVLIFLC